MQPITPFLWFQTSVQDAVNFYRGVFKDCKVHQSSPNFASFELNGQRFLALNGGPMYQFNEAVSFLIHCETQAEVDFYWDALTKGGTPGQCGWLKDPFGLSWQVVPTALGRLMSDPDPVKFARVNEAMRKMTKLDIAVLERAHAGP